MFAPDDVAILMLVCIGTMHLNKLGFLVSSLMFGGVLSCEQRGRKKHLEIYPLVSYTCGILAYEWGVQTKCN